MKKVLRKIYISIILSIIILISYDVNAKALVSIDVSGKSNYDYINEVFKLVNEERSKEGLKPLILDNELTESAIFRAAETVLYFDHVRPDGTLCDTISDRLFGENIAAGQSNPQSVMDSWMKSTGHRENILDDEFESIGIGHFQASNGIDYWVQTFSYYKYNDPYVKSGISDTMTKTINVLEDNIEFNIIYDTYSVNKNNTISPSSAYFINKTIKIFPLNIDYSIFNWESSDKNIFTVDSRGNITGVNSGTSTLKVSLGNVVKEYPISIISKITDVKFNKNKIELPKGSNANLNVTINPIDTTENTTLTWSSSDENVVTVDNNGKIDAVSNGIATITVTTLSGLTDTCTVIVTNQLKGDFSKNGEVKLDDAIIGLRKVFGYILSDENDLEIGDLNNNMKLDLSDIIVLLRYIFGYIKNI